MRLAVESGFTPQSRQRENHAAMGPEQPVEASLQTGTESAVGHNEISSEPDARALVDRMVKAGEWPEPAFLEQIVAAGEAAVPALLDVLKTRPSGWPEEAP